MIPDFLNDLLHEPSGNLYSSKIDGVYVVAKSFDEAQERIAQAADEEVFEVVKVERVVGH